MMIVVELLWKIEEVGVFVVFIWDFKEVFESEYVVVCYLFGYFIYLEFGKMLYL